MGGFGSNGASSGRSGWRWPSASLLPGEVLAGRFEILRSLGMGAMGEVYEALDRELGERVALKMLRPEVAADEALVARFKREVHLARQVTHPNVCRLYDLFRDDRPRGQRASDAAGLVFVSMELLTGESLAERLLRAGPPPLSETLVLARQMAAALGAAHRARVVHRDFKSANVMLVEGESEGGGVRAVVTDFGLARFDLAGEGADATTLTQDGTVLGSPAYMAPEQVRGEVAGAASDLYAFGVVLYEMVAGHLPFEGGSAFQVALRRLEEEPPPLSRFRSDVPAHVENAILACLARDPRDRPADAGEVCRRLEGGAADGASRGRTATRRRSRWTTAALALGLFAALGGLGWLGWLGWRSVGERRPPRPGVDAAAPPASAPVRRRVAVLGFQNLTGAPRAAYLDNALREMLPTEIAASGRMLVVPSENVDRVRRELALGSVRTLAADTLGRVRAAAGADLVVAGSYLALAAGPTAGEIRIDLSIQSTATGETLATWSDRTAEADLVEAVARLGERLRRELGAGELSPALRARVRSAQPGNPEAVRLYAEGLERLRLYDAPAAERLFRRAAAADAKNARIEWALASALSALGREAEALAAARRAVELAADLAASERQLIEARYRGMAGEGKAETALYEQLFRASPDDLELGLGLANAQVVAGEPAAAEATLSTLRRLPPPVGLDPRIDVLEAEAARATGDFERSRAAAARAAARGRRLGARQLVARARFFEGFALRQLGRLGDAAQAAEEARDLAAAAGNRAFEAVAWKEIGALRTLAGDLVGALEAFDRTAAIGREIGSVAQTTFGLNGRAIVLRREGRLSESARVLGEILEIQRRSGDRRGEAASLNGQALAWLDLGRLADAERALEAARRIFVDLGDRSAEGAVLLNRCALLCARGDLDAGRRACSSSRDLFSAIGEAGGVVEAEIGLARIDRMAGRFAAAQTGLERQGAAAARLADGSLVALARSERALLALARGAWNEAERLAREAIAAAPAAEPTVRAEGERWLALALAGAAGSDSDGREARAREAAALLARTRTALAANERLEATFRQALAEAAVAPPGDAPASASLDRAVARAEQAGLAPWRLALAHARALRMGDEAARREIERDARARGLAGVVGTAAEQAPVRR